MHWVIILVIFILCLAGLGYIEAEKYRKKRLEKKLKLEINNLGNIDCRFQLRAEDASGGLSFQFSQNGVRLSEWSEDMAMDSGGNLPESRPVQVSSNGQVSTSSQAQQPKPVTKKARSALETGSVFGNLLVSIGSLLPGRTGSKVMHTGTQIYQTESKVSRVQQVAGDAASLKTGAKPAQVTPTSQAAPSQPAVRVQTGPSWAETPVIQPGKTIMVDLLVCSGWIKKNEARSFQVKSRPTGKDNAPQVVEDGMVMIQGGFWSHRIYPKLSLAALAVLAMALVIWLNYVGILV
jgi:hypothetical protein